MAKWVSHDVKVEVRATGEDQWTDISDLAQGFSLQVARHGLATADLRLINIPDRVVLSAPAFDSFTPRVAIKDRIVVDGIPLSDHIFGYDHVVVVGEIPLIVLHYQCDSSTLRLNGAHPWEAPRA